MAEDVIVLDPGDETAQKIAKAIASPMAGDILHSLADGEKTSSQITDMLGIPMSTAKYHIENLLDAGLVEVAARKWSVKGREIKVYRLVDRLVIVAPKSHRVRDLLLKYASLFVLVLSGSFIVSIILPRIYSLGGQETGSAGELAPMNGIAEKSGGTVAPTLPTQGVQEIATPGMTMTGTEGFAGSGPTGPADLTPLMTPVSGNTGGTGVGPGSVLPSPSVTDVTVSTMPTVDARQVLPMESVAPQQLDISVQHAAVALPLDPALLFLIGGCLVIVALIAYDLYRARRPRWAIDQGSSSF